MCGCAQRERAERDDPATRPQRERSAATHQRLWACRLAGHDGAPHPSKAPLREAFAAKFGGPCPVRCPFEGVFANDPLVVRASEALELLEAHASERTAWRGEPPAVARDAHLILLRTRNRVATLELKKEADE